MNWDQVKGNWKQLKGKAQQMWGDITDDEFDAIEGKRELIDRMMERLDSGNEEAVPQPRLLESLPDDMRFKITPADLPYLTSQLHKFWG